MKKTNLYKNLFTISLILTAFCFCSIFITNNFKSSGYEIIETLFGFGFCLFLVCTIIFWIKDEKICMVRQNDYKEQYVKCLQSQNKSDATYWGKLFYGYKYCATIHQQNNIQLHLRCCCKPISCPCRQALRHWIIKH